MYSWLPFRSGRPSCGCGSERMLNCTSQQIRGERSETKLTRKPSQYTSEPLPSRYIILVAFLDSPAYTNTDHGREFPMSLLERKRHIITQLHWVSRTSGRGAWERECGGTQIYLQHRHVHRTNHRSKHLHGADYHPPYASQRSSCTLLSLFASSPRHPQYPSLCPMPACISKTANLFPINSATRATNLAP